MSSFLGIFLLHVVLASKCLQVKAKEYLPDSYSYVYSWREVLPLLPGVLRIRRRRTDHCRAEILKGQNMILEFLTIFHVFKTV